MKIESSIEVLTGQTKKQTLALRGKILHKFEKH